MQLGVFSSVRGFCEARVKRVSDLVINCLERYVYCGSAITIVRLWFCRSWPVFLSHVMAAASYTTLLDLLKVGGPSRSSEYESSGVGMLFIASFRARFHEGTMAILRRAEVEDLSNLVGLSYKDFVLESTDTAGRG